MGAEGVSPFATEHLYSYPVLPPEGLPGNAGTEHEPASAEGGALPGAPAGESGTDLLQQADASTGTTDGTGTHDDGSARGNPPAGEGAVVDGDATAGAAIAADPSTVSLPTVSSAGEAGAGSAGDRVHRAIVGSGRLLTGTSRALRGAGAAVAGAAALLPGRLSRSGRGAPAEAGAQADEAVKVRSADVAGTVLARLTVLPAVLILAWLIPGVPLLLSGHFLPFPMTLIAVSLAAALTVNGLRVVPASWPRLMSSAPGSGEAGWPTWFGLLATVAVVAGLTAWQLTEGSTALIVLRDPGTYLQSGYWIAQHGSLPIPEAVRAFGGAHAGLHFTSTGFLVRGGSVYPAAMPGLPLLLAGAFWVHGVNGALSMGPVLGGLAALTFAGLVARLVGPQWAPAGALILGLSLPQQYVGRTALSETALQIVVFGGLCLLADSLALRGAGVVSAERVDQAPEARAARTRLAIARQLAIPTRFASWVTPQRTLAGLAGLALSFGLVISLDGIVFLLAVIPFGCALAIGRRPQSAPFLAGIVFGVCYGILGLYLLDRPFLDSVGETAALAGVVAVWLVALSIVAFQLARVGRVRRFVPRALARRPLRWLPEAGAAVAVLVLIGFAVRPYVQTVHGHPSVAVYNVIRSLQRVQGLPVDPTRTYAEQTLYWLIWYIGLPTVLLGAFGLALVVRRCLRALLTWRDPDGVWRAWGLPLAVICAGSAVVLWSPDIVPDQPWASRRLIVMAIPGMIIFALFAASWLARRARDRGARPLTAAAAGLACVAAILVPTVSTTFGLGLSHTGKSGGLKPVAQGMALTRTGVGQVSAVNQLCAAIPRNATVVIVDVPRAQEFAQVIRGWCGVPVAWMAGRPVAAVDSVLSAISGAGRRPLLMAASARQLAPYGGSPSRVLDLATTQDPRDLTQLPTSLRPARYQLWLTAPGPAGNGT